MADITEKLERLFSLLEAGALTREQIEEQRDILLTEARRDSGPPSSGSAPGEPASAIALLQTLGVGLAPTLSLSDPAYEPVQPGAGGCDPVCLGRFQLLGELGRGGMGKVLEARDPEIRRSVAVKVVVDPGQVTEVQLARFVAEAQITGQLQHPNIVPVHEMGVSEEGQLYFVMKKVEGRSLGQVLAALRDGDEAT
ncbi:MAG: protein kinase, partial [Myxococcota bacterium]|nr:protein kinase [Myxococcota bacterium]